MPAGIRPQNLNDVFQAAAQQTRQKLPELTHNQQVRSISSLWVCRLTYLTLV